MFQSGGTKNVTPCQPTRAGGSSCGLDARGAGFAFRADGIACGYLLLNRSRFPRGALAVALKCAARLRNPPSRVGTSNAAIRARTWRLGFRVRAGGLCNLAADFSPTDRELYRIHPREFMAPSLRPRDRRRRPRSPPGPMDHRSARVPGAGRAAVAK